MAIFRLLAASFRMKRSFQQKVVSQHQLSIGPTPQQGFRLQFKGRRIGRRNVQMF
jgi:hypothetical protein